MLPMVIKVDQTKWIYPQGSSLTVMLSILFLSTFEIKSDEYLGVSIPSLYH